tara:strand:+ start:16301 stop:16522 length:222 start_codon:yes stop_codon:yes gene_type:complete
MLHEIFGITDWIEEIADWFTGCGCQVISPDMVWRIKPGFVANYRIPEQREKGLRLRQQSPARAVFTGFGQAGT